MVIVMWLVLFAEFCCPKIHKDVFIADMAADADELLGFKISEAGPAT